MRVPCPPLLACAVALVGSACVPLHGRDCPADFPQLGTSCTQAEGTRCAYDASHEDCGTVECSSGVWQSAFVTRAQGCEAPDGSVRASDPQDPFTTCSAFGTQFGPFDKDCRSAGDCSVLMHEMSCCGDRAAIGISASEKARAAAEEATCQRGFPGCGCASRTLLVEQPGGDGGIGDVVQVDCVAGRCLTRW